MSEEIKVIVYDKKDLETLKWNNSWTILDVEFNTDTQVYEVMMRPFNKMVD